MDVAVGEKLCPPFCQGFGGYTPFLSNALYLLPKPICFLLLLVSAFFSDYFSAGPSCRHLCLLACYLSYLTSHLSPLTSHLRLSPLISLFSSLTSHLSSLTSSYLLLVVGISVAVVVYYIYFSSIASRLVLVILISFYLLSATKCSLCVTSVFFLALSRYQAYTTLDALVLQA